jgi:PAS domain S-box-containing protein
MTSFLGVPIRRHGRSVGNLYLTNKRSAAQFSREDERLVELLAAHAGAIVHQAALRHELEAEKARFTGIVENAPYAVVFVEAGTEKVIVNRRAIELAGQADTGTVASYRGRICDSEGTPLPNDEWPARRVLRGETVERREMIVRGPDGRATPVLLSAAPIRGGDGELEGVVIVYEDISRLKELERQREEWATIVTHDLRQPLNVITMYIGLLQRMAEKPDPQRFHKALEQTRKAAGSLSRMISDLSDASRIDTKRMTIELQAVDLCCVARDVVERQQAMNPGRVIQLTTVDVPKVDADPTRIEQVLDNLVVNAIKYSDAGTPVVVEVHPSDGEVHLLVKNCGPGIAAEELPKLFDRYYRARGARASGVRGLGLGLYIAQGLVHAHGGRISAQSERGGTTTFQIALPVLATPTVGS